MKTYLGIDVGMSGALAFYDGAELMIYDMPVFARNKTSRIDCHWLFKIIQDNAPDHAFIEQVNAFGMGASSAYNFGYGCGSIEALLAAANIPYSFVTPQVWKKAMQCPKDKDAARMRATQLLPRFAHNWDLKKHDGRAEASLIALYGTQRTQREEK
jgi:crossover junction endodeoxyribonuclease RuvC